MAELVVSQMYVVKEKDAEKKRKEGNKGKKEEMRGCRRRTADFGGR